MIKSILRSSCTFITSTFWIYNQLKPPSSRLCDIEPVVCGIILCHLATECHWYHGTGCSWRSLCYFQTSLIIYDLLVLLTPGMVAGCLHKLTRTPKGMLWFFKSIWAPRRHNKKWYLLIGWYSRPVCIFHIHLLCFFLSYGKAFDWHKYIILFVCYVPRGC